MTVEKASSTANINTSNDCLTIVTTSWISNQYENPLIEKYTLEGECLGLEQNLEPVNDYKLIIYIAVGKTHICLISIIIYCLIKRKFKKSIKTKGSHYTKIEEEGLIYTKC